MSSLACEGSFVDLGLQFLVHGLQFLVHRLQLLLRGVVSSSLVDCSYLVFRGLQLLVRGFQLLQRRLVFLDRRLQALARLAQLAFEIAPRRRIWHRGRPVESPSSRLSSGTVVG